jgi:hypothetical protein
MTWCRDVEKCHDGWNKVRTCGGRVSVLEVEGISLGFEVLHGMAGGQGNGTAVLVGTDKTAPFLGVRDRVLIMRRDARRLPCISRIVRKRKRFMVLTVC